MNNRAISYYIVALAMAAGWLFFVHLPETRRRSELQTRIAEARVQLEDFDKTVLELPSFIKTRQDLMAFREQLQSKLYAKNELLKLFARLGQDCSDYNLRLEEIAPPIEELLELNSLTTDKAQFLNITLRVSGNYIDVGKYVQRLEQESFFRGINQCRIAPKDQQGKSLTISLGVRALLYNQGGQA